MTYNSDAKLLAVTAIGTVESRLNYSAINYDDPITVGIMQWYGIRAASILCRMRDENPSSWKNVYASIDSDLRNIGPTNAWWNSRGLTKAEGDSLKPVMESNKVIQASQGIEDLEEYKRVAVNIGYDPDGNTDAMIFFFSMYHQGPKYAFEVVDAVGANATLDQIHAGALANGVLGQYSNRYNEVYEIIREGGTGGGGGGGSVPEPEPDPEPESPSVGLKVRYLEQVGNNLVLHADAGTVYFVTTGSGRWLPTKSEVNDGGTAPGEPADPPTEPTDPPEGGGEVGTGKWVHPLPGAVMTSGYGYRSGIDQPGLIHAGIDFSTTTAISGGNVVAPFDMKITIAREDGTGGFWQAGSFVKAHSVSGPEYTVSFFHMHGGSLTVKPGQVVSAGTKIGVEGQTGYNFGTHMHMEIWPGHKPTTSVDPAGDGPWYWGDGTPIDPAPIFKANGVTF